MKISDLLHSESKNGHSISFEILPPKIGQGIEGVYEILDHLIEFNPPFIDVTYHQEDYEYKKMDRGYFKKIYIRRRPGTVGICAAIKHKYNVEPVPHIICGSFSQSETESALIDLNFLGINNLLALRGDAGKFDKSFRPKEGGHSFAKDLVKQIVDLNHGKYLDDEICNAVKTDFCIGVAGYPEKHVESASYEDDLQHLKAKVDAGADYIVTQMFYNNQAFFKFEKDCRDLGITVPIIPGIKPLTRVSQLKSIPMNFYIDIPNELVCEVRKCNTKEDVKRVGIEWCIAQSKELFAHGVPSIHMYTMGDYQTVSEIGSAIL